MPTNRFSGLSVYIFYAALIAQCAFILPQARAEETGNQATLNLSQEQREEKRLLFSQYVDEQTTRREREKYGAALAEKKKIWLARISSLYGYDSNVNLDSSRAGDKFFEETLSGSIKVPRPKLPGIPWTGRLGMSGYLDIFQYESFERSSYQTALLSIFTEEQVAEKLQLKFAYELNSLRYPEDDQVNYWSHRFKPSLTVYASKTVSITAFGTYELRDYSTREALDASNRATDEKRGDHYAEVGISPKFYPSSQTYISMTVAAKQNDSNDIYRRYSDYYGWKANGMLYQKIRGPLSAAAVAGYDFKQYKGLTFSTLETGRSETQADELYYTGLYLYYDIKGGWQAVGSYLYKQNESNNPLLDWSGSTSSVGLNLSF